MRTRSGLPGIALLSCFLCACGEEPQGVVLRSLESSGQTSLVCTKLSVDHPSDDVVFEGIGLEGCPSPDDETNRLFALVTQTSRGEVAVVDIDAGVVVDEERSIPGYNFLPVGRGPGDIVTTPGSQASFVGATEPGRFGIYALPTSCLSPRDEGEPARDLTTWPACRLPSAPGELAILVDPEDAAGGVRTSCDDPGPRVPRENTQSAAAVRAECPADLSAEEVHAGRRKLAVSLPDRGQIAILDAQELLDRTPGSFAPCMVERWVTLGVELPTTQVKERIPPALDTPACTNAGAIPATGYMPRPAGFAQVDDPTVDEHRLYVADLDAPVIHVLDTRDPCAIDEEPPLLPLSFDNPSRVVTTRKVAASPLTVDPATEETKRFLYAVDARDRGELIPFDVSPGSDERTPLVRQGYPRLPERNPDRIFLPAPVADVVFALRDEVETDDKTGNGVAGVRCDPDPRSPDDGEHPGVAYRPATDFSSGAAPRNLRGVFAFAALSDGSLSVIDVDDFDAACRRPVTANPSPTEDFRGCAGDLDIEGYEKCGASECLQGEVPKPTVTAEESCRIVEPHRPRWSTFYRSDADFGVAAPSLRALPKLFNDVGRSVATDRSDEGKQNPRMLAVNFSVDDLALVHVGSQLYAAPDPKAPDAPKPDNPLVLDPALSIENSLVLSFSEPRAYAPEEQASATYEGVVLGEQRAGRYQWSGGPLAILVDGAVSFCDAGVEDRGAALVRGGALDVAPEDLDGFADQHSDFVTIQQDLVNRDDSFWKGAANACGSGEPGMDPDALEDLADDLPAGTGYVKCLTTFGTRRAPSVFRELQILEARANQLVVRPRNPELDTDRKRTAYSALVACCFPELNSYEIRASNQWVVRGAVNRHAIVNRGGQCVVDSCEARKRLLESRVVEVSCAGGVTEGCPGDEKEGAAVGLADPSRDVACVIDGTSPDALHAENLQTLGGSPCIFDGLTTKFVIYRGLSPSVRDMSFTWQVVGARSELSVPIATVSDPLSMPESLLYSRSYDRLFLTDGANKGLVIVSPRSFGVDEIF